MKIAFVDNLKSVLLFLSFRKKKSNFFSSHMCSCLFTFTIEEEERIEEAKGVIACKKLFFSFI